jgi:hypothetical protein
MLKVAALGNLIAGWCGGMVAFALLVAAPASVHRSQLTRLAGGEAAEGSPPRRGRALGKPRSRGFECRTGDGDVEREVRQREVESVSGGGGSCSASSANSKLEELPTTRR